MSYVIEEHTEDYRGDHGADIVIARQVIPGETVEQLLERCLGRGKDWLVLRRVVTEQERKG